MNWLKKNWLVSEMMGSHINVHIRVQEKEGVMIVDTQGNSNRNFRMGETIHFTFEPAVIHVFDAEGKNLEVKKEL